MMYKSSLRSLLASLGVRSLPGLTSLSILIFPLLLAATFPKIVAIFMLLYITRWCLRLIRFHVFLLVALWRSKKYEKQPWIQMLDAQFPATWGKVFHIAMIAVSKETEDVIEAAVKAVAHVNFPKERLILVLACEERFLETRLIAARLKEQYHDRFAYFLTYFHPDSLPGEARSKGSNISFAGKKISEFAREKGIPPKNILITTLDADNLVHPLYFSVLTYHYLAAENPIRKSFQPLPLAFNNVWEVPIFNRVIALVNSYWQFSKSSQPFYLRNTAAHAQSLEALEELDYWSRQSINEDTHQYFRAYFHFKGDHEVIPLFIPIYQDAVKHRTYFATLWGQYRQLRRWAYSSLDVAYIAKKFSENFRSLPFWKTFGEFVQYFDTHVMWATGPIIVFMYHALPNLLHRGFSQSIFSFNLASILNIYFSIGFLGGLIFLALTLTILPRKPQGMVGWVSAVFQWFLAPFVFIVYGALPAIDAQIRILLGKKLGFQVTEKYRETLNPTAPIAGPFPIIQPSKSKTLHKLVR